jgi:hypothetical protein
VQTGISKPAKDIFSVLASQQKRMRYTKISRFSEFFFAKDASPPGLRPNKGDQSLFIDLILMQVVRVQDK